MSGQSCTRIWSKLLSPVSSLTGALTEHPQLTPDAVHLLVMVAAETAPDLAVSRFDAELFFRLPDLFQVSNLGHTGERN